MILLFISLHFNGHFSGGHELDGTRMSPFWILLELRMREGGGDNRSCKICKTPVKSSTPTNHHSVFFVGWMGCP